MRVALINNNTAVSRLITLSLNKVGAKYIEGDDLELFEGEFDVVVLDSDAGISVDDASLLAPLLIYLAPRGGEQPRSANAVLEKPFLPTEFINVFNEITSGLDVSNVLIKEDESNNNSDEFADFDEIKCIEEIGEFEDILDESELEDSKVDSVDDLSELDEIFLDEPNEQVVDELIKEPVDLDTSDEASIDDLDALLEGEDVQIDELEPDSSDKDTDLDDGDISDLSKELDEEIVLDDDLVDVNDKEDNEINLSDDEASLADAGLGELSSLVDEIESMEVLDLDEIGADEPVQIAAQEIDEVNSASSDEIAELIEEMGLDEISDTDVEQEVDGDELDDESSLDAKEPQNDELDKLDEGLINMLGECVELDEEGDDKQEPCKNGSLDDITQEAMLAAMGVSFDDGKNVDIDDDANLPSDAEFDLDEIKEDISSKISNEVKKVLSQSELKEALKGMKISVNISFED